MLMFKKNTLFFLTYYSPTIIIVIINTMELGKKLNHNSKPQSSPQKPMRLATNDVVAAQCTNGHEIGKCV